MKKLLIIATMLFVTSSARADRIIVTEQTKWLFGTGGAHPEMKTDLININKCVAPIFERHRPKTPLQLAEAKKIFI